MTSLLSSAVHLLGIVAFSAAMLLAMLVLRNPFIPRWLKNEAVAQGVAFVLTAALCVASGNAGNALIAANVHYAIATLLIAAVLVFSIYGFWKLFAVGERLRRADEGRSPFARDRQAPMLLEHTV